MLHLFDGITLPDYFTVRDIINPVPLTPAQIKLRKKHGTPAQFGAALCGCLDITGPEAGTALSRYQKQWDKAGKIKPRKRK